MWAHAWGLQHGASAEAEAPGTPSHALHARSCAFATPLAPSKLRHRNPRHAGHCPAKICAILTATVEVLRRRPLPRPPPTIFRAPPAATETPNRWFLPIARVTTSSCEFACINARHNSLALGRSVRNPHLQSRGVCLQFGLLLQCHPAITHRRRAYTLLRSLERASALA
jgi:hypothetical protein